MDKRMMQAEFEALPFSEDLYVGQFRYGKAYRHRGGACGMDGDWRSEIKRRHDVENARFGWAVFWLALVIFGGLICWMTMGPQ